MNTEYHEGKEEWPIISSQERKNRYWEMSGMRPATKSKYLIWARASECERGESLKKERSIKRVEELESERVE